MKPSTDLVQVAPQTQLRGQGNVKKTVCSSGKVYVEDGPRVLGSQGEQWPGPFPNPHQLPPRPTSQHKENKLTTWKSKYPGGNWAQLQKVPESKQKIWRTNLKIFYINVIPGSWLNKTPEWKWKPPNVCRNPASKPALRMCWGLPRGEKTMKGRRAWSSPALLVMCFSGLSDSYFLFLGLNPTIVCQLFSLTPEFLTKIIKLLISPLLTKAEGQPSPAVSECH